MAAQSSGQSLQKPTVWAPSSSSSNHVSLSLGNSGQHQQQDAEFAAFDDGSAYGVIGSRDGSVTTSTDVDYGTLPLKKHRPRKSGGFILQDLSSRMLEPEPLGPTPQMSEIAKGKRVVADIDQGVPRFRSSRRPNNRRQHSLGSSPLATEVLNAQSEDTAPNYQAQSPVQSTRSNSLRSIEVGTRVNGNTRPTEKGLSSGKRANDIGLDTDPAQIVSLALNLSECRRRNISSGGYHALRDPTAHTRLISSGQPPLGLSYSNGGGSLRQRLQKQRRSLASTSPSSGKSIGSKDANYSPVQQEMKNGRHSSYLSDLGLGARGEVMLNTSGATFIRVKRTKEAFELLYEYRRLLQHIPAIPATASGRPSTSRTLEKVQHEPDITLGRAYNPLQYIRNRKIRIRERKILNADAEGWKDVDKVRAWVDAVKNEREGESTRVDDCSRLPPFDTNYSEPTMVNDSQPSGIAQSKPTQAQKVVRPYNDWTITPWDLLADAYWLDQDDNIKRIEDSSGNKIFRHLVTYKTDSSHVSKDLTTKTRTSASLKRSHASPRRRRRLAAVPRNDPKDQNRPGNETCEPTSPVEERGRRGRWQRGFMRSREPSISDESDWDKESRRRHRNRYRGDREHLDDLALEKQMSDMLAQEAAEHRSSSRSADEGFVAEDLQKPIDFNQSQPNGSVNLPQSQRPKPPQRLKTDMPLSHKHQTPPRTSLDEQRLGHRRMSSDDFDSTSPNSPTTTTFIPSIAINFSPPSSPRLHATIPRTPGQSKDSIFRPAHSRSNSRRAASEHDFGAESKTSLQMSRISTGEPVAEGHGGGLRPTLSNNGLLSPIKNMAASAKPWLQEQRSLKSFKDPGEPDSRLRGFFKGGRLAEIVGSQVSRAGDMLWRKEGGNNASARTSLEWALASGYSDIDDADISALDSSPNDGLSRATTNAEYPEKETRSLTTIEKPRYYMSNLPSFRSPNNREEQSPKSPRASPVLKASAQQHRPDMERGRSSRFDRLAPPKLDMRNVSPSPSPNGRTHNYDQRADDSRGNSASRSRSRVPSHDRLNDMLGTPGKVGTVSKRPTPTGLSGFEARPASARQRPALKGKQKWSVSDRDVSITQGTISKRDIARVRALLLSSGVKANEIVRRADEVPEKPSRLLQDIQDVIKGPIPRVPPAQEHVVAARLLIGTIDDLNSELQGTEDHFSTTTVTQLTSKIDAIDKEVTSDLTPLVRACADNADAFSTDLTTTQTLAVKQLNDSVDLILRKRRRRSRWLRRGGWGMIEWAVLGVMWMVWFIVMVIRFVRGILTGTVRAMRWLFWL